MFLGSDAYCALVNITFVLPLFPDAKEEDVVEAKNVDSKGDQVYLDNYILKFVDNVLYKVDCRVTTTPKWSYALKRRVIRVPK